MTSSTIFDHLNPILNENELIFYGQRSGYLFSVDINNACIRCVAGIMTAERELEFRAVFYFDGYIFLLPYSFSNIFVFDKRGNRVDEIRISNNVFANITGGIIRDSNLYLFGKEPRIIVLNLNTYDVNNIILNKEKLGLSAKSSEWFWTEASKKNSDLYFFGVNNEIVKVDGNNKAYGIQLGEEHELLDPCYISVSDNSINSLYVDNNQQTWMVEYDCNGDELSKKRIEFTHSWNKLPFHIAKRVNDSWVVFPFESNKLYIIGDTIKTYSLGKHYCIHSAAVKDDHIVYGVDTNQLIMISIDVENEEISERELNFGVEEEAVFKSIVEDNISKSNRIIQEEAKWHTLDALLSGLMKC